MNRATRHPETEVADRHRLDKWLWAARFFKSRSLAHDAISGGKVHLGGDRVKPSRTVRLGDVLRIRKGTQIFEVVVQVLSEARKSAAEAALLYTETPESQAQRLVVAAQQRAAPATTRRPSKQGRRLIKQFTALTTDTEDT